MASSTPSLTELAKTVTAAAAALEAALQAKNLKQPSFGPDGLDMYPHDPEIQGIRLQLADAVDDLHYLVNGPHDTLGGEVIGKVHDFTVLNTFNQFNFWDAVPLDGSASISSIAKSVNLPEELVHRLLRHSTTKRLFAILPNGEVVHTAHSALFVKEPLTRSWMGHNMDEVWRSAVNYPNALREWNNDLVEPNKTASSYTFFKDQPEFKNVFSWFNSPSEEWRVARFGKAMNYATASPAFNFKVIHQMFDFAALGPFTFVDVGGSVGHIAFEIAATYPDATCIVQDLPELAPSFAAAVPAPLAARVSFAPQDFFTPQLAPGKDIYFLKHILHDWSDPYAARILQQLVPALTKPGARVLIMDGLVPPPGKAPRVVSRMMSGLDLQMLTMCNAKERTAEDWAALLKLASPKLELVGIHAPPGSAFAMVEAKISA